MRPCHRCREPLGNNAATCPRCGAAQDDGPKVNSGPPPVRSRRGFVRELFTGLADATGLAPAVGVALLGFPLAVGGVLGYLVAGTAGAVVGAVAAVALFVGVAVWAESGG